MVTAVGLLSVVLALLVLPVYRCWVEEKVRAITARTANVVVQKVLLEARAGLACRAVVSSLLGALWRCLPGPKPWYWSAILVASSVWRGLSQPQELEMTIL